MATALRTALALIWGVALGLLSYMILTEVGSEHNLRLALFTFFMAFLSVTFNRFMVLAFTTSALTAWAFVAFVWIILGEATAANAIATWIVAALGMFVFTLPRLVLGEKP